MTDKAQTIKDLRATADLIQKNGLAKHAFYDRAASPDPKDCPVCSLGGVNVTIWGDPEGPDGHYEVFSDEEFGIREERYTAAKTALTAHLGIKIYRIPSWSDAPERTQEEVVAAFRATADALEAS